MSTTYLAPPATAANLNFVGAYVPGGTVLNFGSDLPEPQTRLFQIWTDENYIYCATENGLGIVPIIEGV